MVANELHSIEKNTMEVNGYHNFWGLPTFFKISSFVFNGKNEIHTGLEQLEGWVQPESQKYLDGF